MNVKLRVTRSNVTKLCNQISDVSQTTPIDKTKLGTLASALKLQCDRLEALNTEYENILDESDEENFTKEYEKIEEYRVKVDLALSSVKQLCWDSGSTHNSGNTRVKLPKLCLPVFSGDVLKWFDFYEAFLSSVDSAAISDVEKFSYLKQHLTDEALGTISGLSLSGANYKIAIDLLKKRYDNKQRRMRAHVRELMQIPSPNFREVKSLRSFVDSVNLHVKGLQSLGVASDHYEIFLCEILIVKVSNRTKFEWAKLPDDQLQLENLLALIEQEAKTLDLVDSTNEKPKRTSVSQTYVNASNSARLGTSKAWPNSKVNECSVCKVVGHKPFQCPKLVNAKLPDEKLTMIKSKHLCFNCLGTHHVKHCSSVKRCIVCNGKHHTLIHQALTSPRGDVDGETETATHVSLAKSGAILPVITIPVSTKNGVVLLNALLDSASQRSFIEHSKLSDIAYERVATENLKIVGFGGAAAGARCDVVQLDVVGCEPLRFVSYDRICEMRNDFAGRNQRLLSQAGLHSYRLASSNDISILIGADQYYTVATGNIKRLNDGLVAVETLFGWTIQGPSDGNTTLVYRCQVESLDIKRFWDLESSGILPKAAYSCTLPSESVIDSISIHRTKGRYCVGFPWKNSVSLISSYLREAHARLSSTWKKLSHIDKICEYDAIFQEYLQLGIIERVSEPNQGLPCRYLPHHCVLRDDKTTTKTRIVFDASAKLPDEPSLNECMFEGPNLYPSITGILCRFRLFKHAATADVEKAFLQVSLIQKDRDFVRFLWYDHPQEARDLVHYRFTRVPFGVRASPFLLCAVIQHHLKLSEHYFPNACALLRNNIYMDDVIVSTTQSLNDIIPECVSLFQDMKMNLRKWHTNEKTNHFSSESDIEKTVLGLLWNTNLDHLHLRFSLPIDSIDTKRKLASFTCSIFDPLGLFAPYVLQFKLLLRSVWNQDFDWDVILPCSIVQRTAMLLEAAQDVLDTPVPRWIGLHNSSKVELHGFGDASTIAYGCAVYARVADDKSVTTHLVVSKTRLCPKNTLTVPKLELLAATITSRLLATLAQELSVPISQCHAWSDSKVCLFWIAGRQNVNDVFVSNRVKEINENLSNTHWHYVPTGENPADLTTRECNTVCWLKSSLWWEGPCFLKSLTIEYQDVTTLSQTDASDLSSEHSSFCMMTSAQQCCVIEFSRFSSYQRLLNSLAYLLRFVRLPSKPKFTGPISRTELNESEILAIKQCQLQAFSDEIKLLQLNMPIQGTSRFSTLTPFLDESGVLRSNGRLSCSESLSYDEKCPIILPDSHHFTKLLIMHTHWNCFHASATFLLHKLRAKYWILKSRRTVKGVLGHCIVCRRYKSECNQQPHAPLPTDRVDISLGRPFEHSGVDYFGPLISTKECRKFYVLLFTCLMTRAVHLEATHSLDSKDFLLAFDRFISRRGCPKIIRSDNAKTFVAAAKLMEQKHQVIWKFSVSRAPWTGGVWERMVRTVKNALKFALKTMSFSYVDLCTCLCKVEFIVNDRPITYVSNQLNEPKALTPNDFLLAVPSDSMLKNNINREKLVKGYLSSSALLKKFWKRWRYEYLCLLQRNLSSANGGSIGVGHVVLLNNGAKRSFWPLCLVEEVYPGRDGKVRSAKIRCAGKSFVRPAKLLYNLEITN